jgi:hypothetical protein
LDRRMTDEASLADHELTDPRPRPSRAAILAAA